MYLVDHTDKTWLQKVRRINGAFTYSNDLVKHQIPRWEKVLKENDIISTCPKLSDTDVKGEYGTAYQYLHSYPYTQAVERTRNIAKNLPFKSKKIVFLSAYTQFVQMLTEHGLSTKHCPMAIDVEDIKKKQLNKDMPGRIIYFGNVVHDKVHLFNILKRECRSAGLKFDYISNGRLNATTQLSRDEALSLVSRYEYGIGVGRCAQEMMALGVKTLIAGHYLGGLITTEDEYITQLETNMNGRLITYSDNIKKCLSNLDIALLRYNDIARIDHTQ